MVKSDTGSSGLIKESLHWTYLLHAAADRAKKGGRNGTGTIEVTYT